jgi:secreted protein with Ig-like and vWFA domain
MGGTEIFSPMEEILDESPSDGFARQILLLTDGAVHNSQAIIDLIKNKASKVNSTVYTFGIGSGADEYLVREAALAGDGAYSLISQNSQIESKVVSALLKIRVPAMRIVSIEGFDD